MFGELVRAHRRRLGWTQELLAEKSGVTVRTIGKIESGRIAAPRPTTARLLAEAFGLEGADREAFHRAAEPAAPVAKERPGPVPAQLPPDVYAFTGRGGELEDLDRLLTAVGQGWTAVVISAVSGTAGVGKPNPELWRSFFVTL
jgi:transcriptional regulator with XRE-family HTH domain